VKPTTCPINFSSALAGPIGVLNKLGVNLKSPETTAATLPFASGDATCGVENELQAVVVGAGNQIDLAWTIEQSNYYRNMVMRHDRGELPRRVITELESWLADNPAGVWENSWVRLPVRFLSPLARQVLERDLLIDKNDPAKGRRGDVDRFIVMEGKEPFLRIPVSYLLKLSLIDVVGIQADGPALIKQIGLTLVDHFLSDNTSPETYSFYVSPPTASAGQGLAVAAETGRRFLLTQLLILYAGRCFGLLDSGQKAVVYFAPHPPVRQKQLSQGITDSFYRELFMNPCLSGWDRGEDKHEYMHLCHQVLSRAQLNALARLREAGIITRNLVTLPSASNISLANNGTHVSLGSRRLTQALADPSSGFTIEQEKQLGDLVIKFFEHFLPLFVGFYSAAPYRLGFGDFHPEKVLSFLPYELDYTHLRMIWRRWKKKAHLKIRPWNLGLTPFGPPWLDRTLSRLFRLRGDFVPDFRLIDYLVAIMSTDRSPALDGRLGNQERLKRDLAQLGVFDPRMSVYLPYRQREFGQKGFSGFEGRYYSLFGSLDQDLAPAVELQTLITALAFQLIASGRLIHAHIPDDPVIESERRQVFFGAAIGLPTFFVKADTRNLFLRSILEQTREIRPSRRYPGYLRIKHHQYRLALTRLIDQEAASLVEGLNLAETMSDLKKRLQNPDEYSAGGRLTRGILDKGRFRSPLRAEAEAFNLAAESFYREELRLRYIEAALDGLEQDLGRGNLARSLENALFRAALRQVLGDQDPAGFVGRIRRSVLNETMSREELVKLINLVMLTIHAAALGAAGGPENQKWPGEYDHGLDNPPIHRAANG